MRSEPAAGGGRRVAVPPERLERWLAGFVARHGPAEVTASGTAVTLAGPDGATAWCEVPFPPLLPGERDPYGGLVAHALADRRVGVLLVRLGGHAAGVFDGPRLVASKVGSRLVHGRSAAGGQSQQRFARRREGQARVALAAAVEDAVRVLVPAAAGLDAVVLGGDRHALDLVLADRRLAPLLPLATGPVLDVPEPRLRVLQQAPEQFRAVRITVGDPPP
ncbi:MAG TPA: acVLRF1 family peptidyl-tRNA hydrolase [Mycobacteriales bacterium]